MNEDLGEELRELDVEPVEWPAPKAVPTPERVPEAEPAETT